MDLNTDFDPTGDLMKSQNRFAFLFGFCIAALMTSPLQAADKVIPGSDYYPKTPGTQWTYKARVNDQTLTMINKVTKIENINGIEMSRVETSAGDNMVLANEHISINEKGIYRNRINGSEPDPAVCILRFPIKAGDAWEINSKVGNETIEGTYKTSNEDVTVPAGKYKTIKVVSEADVKPSGQKIFNTVWMAEGIGIVKQFTDLGPVQITLELEKFEAGK